MPQVQRRIGDDGLGHLIAAMSMLILAGCGPSNAATETSTPRVAPTPSATAPATPTPTPGGAPTGGYGDTSGNLDSTYACGYEEPAQDGVTVLAYITVAGSSGTDTSALCGNFSQNSSLHQVQSFTPPGTSSDCWITAYDGGGTARVYQAPTGNATGTQEICAALFSGVGLSIPAPSPSAASSSAPTPT
jgi:hypothetical protein